MCFPNKLFEQHLWSKTMFIQGLLAILKQIHDGYPPELDINHWEMFRNFLGHGGGKVNAAWNWTRSSLRAIVRI